MTRELMICVSLICTVGSVEVEVEPVVGRLNPFPLLVMSVVLVLEADRQGVLVAQRQVDAWADIPPSLRRVERSRVWLRTAGRIGVSYRADGRQIIGRSGKHYGVDQVVVRNVTTAAREGKRCL